GQGLVPCRPARATHLFRLATHYLVGSPAEQSLGLVERGAVAVRRAVAPGPLAGDLGLAARLGAVAVVEGELGQDVVDIGLLEAVLAAVGDRARLFGPRARLGSTASKSVPARPLEQ